MELSRERRHESSFQTIDDFKFVVQLAGSPFQFSRSRPILFDSRLSSRRSGAVAATSLLLSIVPLDRPRAAPLRALSSAAFTPRAERP